MGLHIHWFRRDLRLNDQEFLSKLDAKVPFVGVYIFDSKSDDPWRLGGASKWWLHHSLKALKGDLKSRGSDLLIFSGDTRSVLKTLRHSLGASLISFSQRVEPSSRALEARLLKDPDLSGVLLAQRPSLLIPPPNLLNQSGRPFQVYTPFWRALRLQAKSIPECVDAPARIVGPSPKDLRKCSEQVELDTLGLLPKIEWDRGFYESWKPGEVDALDRLKLFIAEKKVFDYGTERNIPGTLGTSRLSPSLHFGELSPQRFWHQSVAAFKVAKNADHAASAEHFAKELVWREFGAHLLFHFPHTDLKPLRPEFEKFPWSPQEKIFKAWKLGKTGFPIIDAGMRELWHTGWMHNRVRMIVASFLVKNLLVPWTDGAKYFWDTLVDADLASNSLGWQWTAGSGADAAPYYRIFNPILQGERFDPEGVYIKRWVPELSEVPVKFINTPWLMPSPPKSYPAPIVDLAKTRDAALAAYQVLKKP